MGTKTTIETRNPENTSKPHYAYKQQKQQKQWKLLNGGNPENHCNQTIRNDKNNENPKYIFFHERAMNTNEMQEANQHN